MFTIVYSLRTNLCTCTGILFNKLCLYVYTIHRVPLRRRYLLSMYHCISKHDQSGDEVLQGSTVVHKYCVRWGSSKLLLLKY